MKTFIRQWIESKGYQITKKREEYARLDYFHLALMELIRQKGEQNFYFVQVGANDGCTRDPISKYVREYKWGGILLEPQPRVFERLLKNYEGESHLHFVNAAINNTDGTTKLYVPKKNSDNETRDDVFASMNQDHLKTYGSGQFEEIEVQAISFNSLFKEHNVNEVDLLQIDTEGFDFQVLKLFEFEKYRPALVQYEETHLSHEDKEEAFRLLQKYGYTIHTDGFNVLASQFAKE